MKDVLLITHAQDSTTGTVKDWCESRGFRFDIKIAPTLTRNPDIGEFDYRALIVFGGDMEAWETTKYPWLVDEKSLIRQFVEQRRGVFGICLGSQLLAETLGAKITDMGEWEFGWFPVKFKNGNELCPMHCHSSKFSLPPGTQRIATDRFDTEQGFKAADGSLVGFQFHVEIDQTRIDHILSGLKHAPTGRAQSPRDIRKGFELHAKDLKAWAFKALDVWWAQVAGAQVTGAHDAKPR